MTALGGFFNICPWFVLTCSLALIINNGLIKQFLLNVVLKEGIANFLSNFALKYFFVNARNQVMLRKEGKCWVAGTLQTPAKLVEEKAAR